MRAALSLAIASALLAACGGNDDGTKTEAIDYSKLETTPNSAAHLVLVDDEQLGEHLKNGMRLQLVQGYSPPFLEAVPGAPVPATDAVGGGSRGNFSETNVHVAGVDEADYAKYDGKHWFVATYPRYDLDRPEAKPGFQVVATDPATPDADIISSFSFGDDWGDVGALYLVKNGADTSHVASVRSQWGNVYPMLPGFPIDLIARPAIGGAAIDALIWPGPQNSKVQVQLVDVSDPTKPEQDWKIELDGSLINSRKIGETLYLITRYDPWIAALKYETTDKGARAANETALADADTEELVPHYRIGAAEYPLTRDCYVQEGLGDYHGLGSLVHITAVDLAGQKVLSSTCLNSSVENLSMSPDALYLTGTIYDRNNGQHSTIVHKFSLAETGPKYEATGSVEGGLNRTADPQFRMHEHDGMFRIVTSTWNNTGPVHKLTILTQRDGALVLQGKLPNSASPGPIGKPGEDIYAVRFVGDRAYLVTFQRTDPLYTIDLSNPGLPKVIGELEIPGFATYMHPVGDGLLFTLGHSADNTGRVTGVKADLFDVAGDQPKLINSVQLSDASGYSEALNNLHALSVLPYSDDVLRFALPLTRYDTNTWRFTGLQLLAVTGITGTAKLVDAGAIVAEGPSTSRYPGQGVDRGILHNNAVFYAHNNAIWAAHWDKPKEAKGPIVGDPIACTLEARPSLEVHLISGDRTQTADLCLATVTAVQGEARFELDGYPAPTSNPAAPAADLIPLPTTGGCVFSGPHEVGGYFDVHVSMRGYLPESIKEVYVPKGICHVQTQQLQVVLKPE
jgi:hypothetical protein